MGTTQSDLALASKTISDDNLSFMQRYPWWVNPSYASRQKWKQPRRLVYWTFSGAPGHTATTRVVVEAMRNASFLLVLMPGVMLVYGSIFLWDSPGAGEVLWIRVSTNWIMSLPVLWVACTGASAWALHAAGWDRGRCPRTLRRFAAYVMLVPYMHAAISYVLVAWAFGMFGKS